MTAANWSPAACPPGNVADRQPVPQLAQRLFGQLFADQGSLSQPLAEPLFVAQGLQSITQRRKRLHKRLVAWSDTVFLRRRAISETITDPLKTSSPIERTRQRSPVNFLVKLVAGLIASCHQPEKPALGLFADTRPPA